MAAFTSECAMIQADCVFASVAHRSTLKAFSVGPFTSFLDWTGQFIRWDKGPFDWWRRWWWCETLITHYCVMMITRWLRAFVANKCWVGSTTSISAVGTLCTWFLFASQFISRNELITVDFVAWWTSKHYFSAFVWRYFNWFGAGVRLALSEHRKRIILV